MCGIFGYFPFSGVTYEFKLELYKAFMKLQDRGPDRSFFREITELEHTCFIGFHRLIIMDKSIKGDQPFTSEQKDEKNNRTVYVMCNGEIYNHKTLITEHDLIVTSGSDCEVLLPLYLKLGFTGMIESLRGEFAICVFEIDYETENINVYIGRDQTAVRPIFVGLDENGFGFSSTLAGIVNIISPDLIRQVEGAEILHLTLKNDNTHILETKYYHDINNVIINTLYGENKDDTIPTIITDDIRAKFIESVEIRLQSDRPLGALLSGGLDSSLIVSIASLNLAKSGKRLKTYSIGIPGSTDRKYAEMVSVHCGTDHTHVEFTEQDFLDAIPEVISVIESYDITTVRASVGQYLISKWIRENTNIKVLLIGDGSDELCSGYIYFHNAPTPYDSHLENIRLLKNIHLFDSLRADRSIASNGIEARVPFLDHQFVDLYLSIPYKYRVPLIDESLNRKTEKYLLRKSFDNDIYLPKEVLWRKKEAFSDGVSSNTRSWYSVIQSHLENLSIEMDDKVNYHLKPTTNESLYYRLIFNEIFHYKAAGVIPYYWMPKWSGNVNDPSARVLENYNT